MNQPLDFLPPLQLRNPLRKKPRQKSGDPHLLHDLFHPFLHLLHRHVGLAEFPVAEAVLAKPIALGSIRVRPIEATILLQRHPAALTVLVGHIIPVSGSTNSSEKVGWASA